MKKLTLSNKAWGVAGVIGAMVIVAFISYLFSSASDNQIPSAFTEARVSASQYAQEIVSSLAGVSERINKLQNVQNHPDKRGVRDAINAEIEMTRQVRDKAILLSQQLEQMALSIPDISPSGAAQTVLVGISQETALITKLLTYNNDLNQLLLDIEQSLKTQQWNYNQLNGLISSLNNQMKEINDLNDRFKIEMQKFDAYYQSPQPSISVSAQIETSTTTATSAQ